MTTPLKPIARHTVAAARSCVFGIAAAGFLCLMPQAATAQVVVLVNGSPITALDIEHRTRFTQLTAHKNPTRQETLNELIDDKLKIFIAKRYGLEISDQEVENSFADMGKRMRMTPDQLAVNLQGQGMSANALKSKIRADLSWQQLVRGKFGASLQVGESDIARAMAEKPDEKEDVGYLYTLRPIVFVVPRGSQVSEIENKRREAEALRARFTSCDEGVRLARSLRDVAVRDPVVRSSAEMPTQLRDLLGSMQIGRLTVPEPITQGVQMFALCDKKVNTSETARKNEVRSQIFQQRFEKESKKFLDEVRRGAMIEYR